MGRFDSLGSMFGFGDDEENPQQPAGAQDLAAPAQAPTIEAAQQLAAAPAPSSDAQAPDAAAAPAPAMNQDLATYLQNKYPGMFAKDNQDIKDAQDRAQSSTLISNIFQGLEGVGRARGQAYGGQGVDTASWDNFNKGLQQPVQNAQAKLTRDQQAMKSEMDVGKFGQETTLNNQAITQGDLKTKALQRADQEGALDFANKKNLLTPGTTEAQALTNFIRSKGIDPKAPDGLSVTQLNALYPNSMQAFVQMRDTDKKTAAEIEARRMAMGMEMGKQGRETLQHAQDKLMGDKRYTEGQEELTNTDRANELLEKAKFDPDLGKGNPAAYQALSIALAKIVAPGRLNEQELKGFGGSRGVMDRLGQITAEAAGRGISAQNYVYLKSLVKTLHDGGAARINGALKDHGSQYSSVSGLGYQDAVSRLLGRDSSQIAAATPSSQATSSPASQPQDGAVPAAQYQSALKWVTTDPNAAKDPHYADTVRILREKGLIPAGAPGAKYAIQ